MNLTILDILTLCWPDRGGWMVDFTDPPVILAGDRGPVPTLEEIESKRSEAELLMPPPVKVWPNVEYFMAEFSLEEMGTIALSNHPVIAALRLLLSAWHSAVRADDARVMMGLNALVSAGIIDEARRTQILTPAPAP